MLIHQVTGGIVEGVGIEKFQPSSGGLSRTSVWAGIQHRIEALESPTGCGCDIRLVSSSVGVLVDKPAGDATCGVVLCVGCWRPGMSKCCAPKESKESDVQLSRTR